jgi:hypothetical protein
MLRTWRVLPFRLLAIALIGLFEMLTSGCANITTPERQTNNSAPSSASQSQDNSAKHSPTNSQGEDDPASAQNPPDAPVQFGLKENMPYREARSLLIQQGWQPNVQGDPPNLNNSTVKELVDLGYEEVKDCAGTGLGPCRFEFTNKAGELLVVSAITNGASNQDRVVWRWFIEERTNSSQ